MGISERIDINSFKPDSYKEGGASQFWANQKHYERRKRG